MSVHTYYNYNDVYIYIYFYSYLYYVWQVLSTWSLPYTPFYIATHTCEGLI